MMKSLKTDDQLALEDALVQIDKLMEPHRASVAEFEKWRAVCNVLASEIGRLESERQTWD